MKQRCSHLWGWKPSPQRESWVPFKKGCTENSLCIPTSVYLILVSRASSLIFLCFSTNSLFRVFDSFSWKVFLSCTSSTCQFFQLSSLLKKKTIKYKKSGNEFFSWQRINNYWLQDKQCLVATRDKGFVASQTLVLSQGYKSCFSKSPVCHAVELRVFYFLIQCENSCILWDFRFIYEAVQNSKKEWWFWNTVLYTKARPS